MDKKTFKALQVLMAKIDRHVLHATYQEDTRVAYAQVSEWMLGAEEDYINQDGG